MLLVIDPSLFLSLLALWWNTNIHGMIGSGDSRCTCCSSASLRLVALRCDWLSLFDIYRQKWVNLQRNDSSSYTLARNGFQSKGVCALSRSNLRNFHSWSFWDFWHSEQSSSADWNPCYFKNHLSEQRHGSQARTSVCLENFKNFKYTRCVHTLDWNCALRCVGPHGPQQVTC